MTIPDDQLTVMPASQAGQIHDLLTIFEHLLAWLTAHGDPATVQRMAGWTARLTGGGDLAQLHTRATTASDDLAAVLTGRSHP